MYYLDEQPWFARLINSPIGKIFILKVRTKYQHKLSRLRWQIAMANILITLTFSVMLGWLISKLVLTPIRRLGDAASDLSKGEKDLLLNATMKSVPSELPF